MYENVRDCENIQFWSPEARLGMHRSATGYVTQSQGFDCDVMLNIMPEYKDWGLVK
jgi:hypothetical protein